MAQRPCDPRQPQSEPTRNVAIRRRRTKPNEAFSRVMRAFLAGSDFLDGALVQNAPVWKHAESAGRASSQVPARSRCIDRAISALREVEEIKPAQTASVDGAGTNKPKKRHAVRSDESGRALQAGH